ncbi:hypothetical protein DTO271G3_7312 [Paecilomyces variotii]|nr:hypothetical protein DTO271G3_7312 [Paecilomyces variotii]
MSGSKEDALDEVVVSAVLLDVVCRLLEGHQIEDLGESLLIDLTINNDESVTEEKSEDQTAKGKKRTKSPKKAQKKIKSTPKRKKRQSKPAKIA